MKLYEIATIMLDLESKLENVESEDMEQCIKDTLEGIEFELEEKAENIIKLTKNYESDINSIDAEVKRLQELKKSKQRNIDSLKEYLKRTMVDLNKPNLETSLFRITVKNNPPKVFIRDEHEVPSEFMKVKYEVDKTELKKALSDEEKAKELNELGISLIQEQSLMIK